MSFDFQQYLEGRLKRESLPGRPAQMKMAPKPVSKTASLRRMDPPRGTPASSVLLLLYSGEEGRLELIITLRTDSINHGGQLSLPGGRSEAGESTVQTALRETQEEIGIRPEDVTVAGQLSELYVAHSGNDVTPVVGFLNYVPTLNINREEVQEAFCITLDELLCTDNQVIEEWNLRDEEKYEVPFWDVHRVPLWGATAMILSEFMELYREYKQECSNNK